MTPRDYYEKDMEMPVPCQSCGRWFDLTDGCGSEKWYPGTVICNECSDLEEQEIQLDDDIEECNNQISDAEYTIKEKTIELSELQQKKAELETKIDQYRTQK